MGFINSLKDETKFLFSGKGMPYEKVCLTVAMIISVFLSVLLAGNFAKDAPVIVIDLDNSRYSREFITQIDSSEYMKVKAVLNVATNPDELFYRDEADAVIYLPEGLEKNFYNGNSSPVGIHLRKSPACAKIESSETILSGAELFTLQIVHCLRRAVNERRSYHGLRGNL